TSFKLWAIAFKHLAGIFKPRCNRPAHVLLGRLIEPPTNRDISVIYSSGLNRHFNMPWFYRNRRMFLNTEFFVATWGVNDNFFHHNFSISSATSSVAKEVG